MRFKRSELLEASVVTVPANPRARRIGKSFFNDDELDRLFAKPGENGGRVIASTLPGKHAETHITKTGGWSMTTTTGLPLGKRIEATEQNINVCVDRLNEIAKAISESGGAPTDEQATEIEAVTAQKAAEEKALTTLKNLESGMLLKAQTSTIKVPAVPIAQKVPKRELIVRALTCQVISKLHAIQGKMITEEQVLAERYASCPDTAVILKAAMSPASTVVPAWAGDLVGTTMGEFINLLPTGSIYPALSAIGPKFAFGRNGIIKVPSRSSTPKINGSFVGEANPIPVRKLGVASITLTPKKMAVISEFSREIGLHSTPSIESVIRQAINEDTAEAIDTALIDATAADAVRPHGLRYNQFTGAAITGLTPSAATATFDKMVADIKALIAAIVANRGGRNLVLICNPAQALALEWIVVDGRFVFESVEQGTLRGLKFVESHIVPAGMLIMVDAADFATVTGDSPQFDVSDVATIHEEDTTPLPIVGGTVQPPVIGSIAAPVRSLWQTASIGIRMILEMNWHMRRPGMVSWMTGVSW
jgi:HK97 family phage major capsid protein